MCSLTFKPVNGAAVLQLSLARGHISEETCHILNVKQDELTSLTKNRDFSGGGFELKSGVSKERLEKRRTIKGAVCNVRKE